jgi:hypothetical protein
MRRARPHPRLPPPADLAGEAVGKLGAGPADLVAQVALDRALVDLQQPRHRAGPAGLAHEEAHLRARRLRDRPGRGACGGPSVPHSKWRRSVLDNLVAVVTGKHKDRLVKAAGVASVDLVCAGDTWRAIYTQCARLNDIVPLPDRDAGGEGQDLQPVSLTGPQLALMLTKLFRGARAYSVAHAHERAVYQRVYDAAATVLNEVDLKEAEGKPIPPIVIDARLGSE